MPDALAAPGPPGDRPAAARRNAQRRGICEAGASALVRLGARRSLGRGNRRAAGDRGRQLRPAAGSPWCRSICSFCRLAWARAVAPSSTIASPWTAIASGSLGSSISALLAMRIALPNSCCFSATRARSTNAPAVARIDRERRLRARPRPASNLPAVEQRLALLLQLEPTWARSGRRAAGPKPARQGRSGEAQPREQGETSASISLHSTGRP